jgi:spermidine synthase
MPELPSFFEMPSPVEEQPGTLRLLESRDSSASALRQQLLEGSYDKPFLLEADNTRSLLFNFDFIQSCMRLDAPDALEFLYTHHMMAFLLFHTNVKSILLLGLGGGSLAKFCRRHLPEADLTAVELNADVLALRRAFAVPPDGARFRVVLGDAGEVVATSPQQFDVLLVDAFDRAGVAASVAEESFYVQARRRLAARGVLVANLVGEAAERRAHLELIRQAFGDNLLLVSVEEGCNHVAFAFREANFEPRWKWIQGQAKAMSVRYGLDFPKIAERLERNWRRGWENVAL